MGHRADFFDQAGIYISVTSREGAGPLNDVIWKRAIDVGEYIQATGATVRETARAFGISKSTVHKDVTDRLPKIRPQLAKMVREVLDLNKAQRHLRGGEATRRKYSSNSQKIQPG